jgi:putative addiction module component (TIGR02574 family)
LLGALSGAKIAILLKIGGIMAAEALERIRAEVLKLTEAERAELAHDLIASLDEPRESGVEDAWDREILHRISLVDSGQAKLLDREEFRQKMRARYKDQ